MKKAIVVRTTMIEVDIESITECLDDLDPNPTDKEIMDRYLQWIHDDPKVFVEETLSSSTTDAFSYAIVSNK